MKKPSQKSSRNRRLAKPKLASARAKAGAVATLPVGVFAGLLGKAEAEDRGDILAYLALGGLVGLRHGEIMAFCLEPSTLPLIFLIF